MGCLFMNDIDGKIKELIEKIYGIKDDLNKSKIYLSLKRLIEDPWKAVKDKYVIFSPLSHRSYISLL